MIPLDGLSVILGHALARLVKHSQIELRRRIALFSGFAEPFGRLAVFLRHPQARLVAEAQITLRVFMKRPERGLQAASCVIAAKSREISWQPCNADAEAA
jgi:hypothetical protein